MSSLPDPSPAPADASQTFETSMERLETVVAQMENSKLPLEDLIRCYEEGTRLVKVCTERLAAAEQRIEMITRDAAGEPQVTPFPPAGTTPPSPKSNAREPKPAQESPAAPARSAKKNNEVSLF